MRGLNRLTDSKCRGARCPENQKICKLSDGGGLYLCVYRDGRKLWRIETRINGRPTSFGLGRYPEVGLAEARKRRDEIRRLIREGRDPRVVLRYEHKTTFEAVSEEWLMRQKASRARSYVDKLEIRLRKHVLPAIGNLDMNEITPRILNDFLGRIYESGRQETSNRCKIIIGQVFRYAMLMGLAKHDPTVALRGFYTPRNVRHMPSAVRVDDFREVVRSIWLREWKSVAMQNALKLLTYTFVRPGELCGMQWNEIDWTQNLWVIPRARMKTRKNDHLVPLARQSLEILNNQRHLSGRRFVFPSPTRPWKSITVAALESALRRCGVDFHTPHGFRASARTLLHETLNFQPQIIEIQLSHSLGEIERAYARASHLQERRRMMQTWADFIDDLVNQKAGRIISLAST